MELEEYSLVFTAYRKYSSGVGWGAVCIEQELGKAGEQIKGILSQLS